jgi:hypothetical protein
MIIGHEEADHRLLLEPGNGRGVVLMSQATSATAGAALRRTGRGADTGLTASRLKGYLARGSVLEPLEAIASLAGP